MYWHLSFQGLQRSWKINKLKGAIINRTCECGALFLNDNPWLALEIGRETETGRFLFLDRPAWGYHTAHFFFTSLSISQTNPLVLARITELPEIPPIGPLGSWGYDECLLYGNDQAKLKVFRVGPEWLENQSRFLNYTTYHFWLQMLQLISVLRSFVEINHSTIFFSVLSFFSTFFSLWKNRQTKSPFWKMVSNQFFSRKAKCCLRTRFCKCESHPADVVGCNLGAWDQPKRGAGSMHLGCPAGTDSSWGSIPMIPNISSLDVSPLSRWTKPTY